MFAQNNIERQRPLYASRSFALRRLFAEYFSPTARLFRFFISFSFFSFAANQGTIFAKRARVHYLYFSVLHASLNTTFVLDTAALRPGTGIFIFHFNLCFSRARSDGTSTRKRGRARPDTRAEFIQQQVRDGSPRRRRREFTSGTHRRIALSVCRVAKLFSSNYYGPPSNDAGAVQRVTRF